jgi:hypothetical protein
LLILCLLIELADQEILEYLCFVTYRFLAGTFFSDNFLILLTFVQNLIKIIRIYKVAEEPIEAYGRGRFVLNNIRAKSE